MSEENKKRVMAYYYIIFGVRAYHAMKQGLYAKAAHVIKRGLKNGVIEPDDDEGSSWRTSILMNYSLDEL